MPARGTRGLTAKLTLAVIAACLFCLQSSCASDTTAFMRVADAHEAKLDAPPEGKALVNFHRPTDYGYNLKYMVWDETQAIGNTGGLMMFQYVCDPGEHYFLGEMGKTTVIHAELLENEVYDVVVHVGSSLFSASVSLEPVGQESTYRTELDAWDDEEPLWILVTDEEFRTTEAEKRDWALETVREFTTGSRTDELQHIAPDDHR